MIGKTSDGEEAGSFRQGLKRIVRRARPDRGLPEELFRGCLEEAFGSRLADQLVDWRYRRGVLHLIFKSHAACSDATFLMENLRERINALLEESMGKEEGRPVRSGRTRSWVVRIRLETGNTRGNDDE